MILKKIMRKFKNILNIKRCRCIPWPVQFPSQAMSDIKIGKLTTPGMSSGCLIQGINGIIIGNNLWCGPGVKIIGVNHDETDYYQHEHQGTRRVETNVWIGAESIVTQDIESDSVATGNPTKIIRKKKPYREDPI